MHNRREFLATTASLAASTTLLPVSSRAANPASSGPLREPGVRGVIVISLAGGNDGLNTIVPVQSPAYRQARPTLALPRENLVEVTSGTAFPPALASFVPLWNAGLIAIERQVGVSEGRPSHASSTEQWQAAVREVPARWRETDRELPLREQLRDAAEFVVASPERSTVWVTLAGFDTHTRQADSHPHLLKEMAESVADCVESLVHQRRFDEARILVVSEFGRSLFENQFAGTDHGVGTVAFAIGAGINPERQIRPLHEIDLRSADGVRATLSPRDFVRQFGHEQPRSV